MNEFNLVNIISDIISFGDEENYVQNIKVFLIRMTKSKNEIYKLEANDKTKELLFSSLKEELDKIYKELTLNIIYGKLKEYGYTTKTNN